MIDNTASIAQTSPVTRVILPWDFCEDTSTLPVASAAVDTADFETEVSVPGPLEEEADVDVDVVFLLLDIQSSRGANPIRSAS